MISNGGQSVPNQDTPPRCVVCALPAGAPVRINGASISPMPGSGSPTVTSLSHNDRIMLGNDTFFLLSLEHETTGVRHTAILGGSPANAFKAQVDWQCAKEEVEQVWTSLVDFLAPAHALFLLTTNV